MWLVLIQIPLSSNAYLDPSQPVPGWRDQREYLYGALVWVRLRGESVDFCLFCTSFFHQQEGWRLTLHCSGNLQNGRGCNRAADMRSFDLGIVSFFALAWVISSLWVVTPHRGPLWELIVRIFFSTMPLLFINGLLSSFYCKLYMGLCWFLSVYERMRIKIWRASTEGLSIFW